MEPKALLAILSVAEKLKCNTRHCYTSSGRHESVAEHSWRLALMAMLLKPAFPDADMDKVIRMCLIHDMGEAFTGDIPAFDKTAADAGREDAVLMDWVQTLPADTRREWTALLTEMNALETSEARIYKALDKLEAVIQHNESDISTWLPLEYDLQLTYGGENVAFSPYLRRLKQEIDDWTRRKIAENT
ncbi:MAG: HD domain-containing protein [Firmicutes bacterium]|nr:HD domain-containing protein [Bacillota bacterium]